MTEAYPLHWPSGWPRTPVAERQRPYRFGTTERGSYRRVLPTFAKSRDRLLGELDKLGAINIVISSNHSTDRYGYPVESKRKVQDDSVAVYFEFMGKPMVMACDRYDDAAGNMTSLALAIEAMRQLDRHGGGTMMERAFTGFLALPAAGPPWYAILCVRADADEDEINRAYRAKAKTAHSDVGGTDAAMTELNVARDEGLKLARARA